MEIRTERPEDYSTVENLTREAFWNVYRPGCNEHYVLHLLRTQEYYVPKLSCVIEDAGKIVAHIAYACGTLTRADESVLPMLMFGPVSVLPERQGEGLGSKLIRYTLEQAQKLGYPGLVITGNPKYYSRFGFETASRHGIVYAEAEPNDPAPYFMLKVLDPSAISGLSGSYSDPPCFFPDPAETEEFDRSFPPKVKEKREGQLE